MVFRKGGHLSKSEKWFYQGKKIEVVNSYKYLGFTLTTKLSFDVVFAEFAGKAKGRVVEIMKTLWRLGNNDPSVFFRLFDAQVKPIILYASEIWGLTRFNVVESAHIFACKTFLRVSPKTPNCMVYGELGRYPLFIDSALRAVKYWFKLQRCLLNRITRQAYEMDKKSFQRKLTGHSYEYNWVYMLKHFFDNYGFSHVWINGGVGNEKLFLRILRLRMIDCYRQEWSSKLSGSDRFSIYRSFKQTLEPERYFRDISLAKFRNVFVKFRLGIVDLNVNNRYNNAANKCPFCNSIETELHFLLFCHKYKELRDKYIRKHFKTNNVQLSALIQNDNTEITRSVAMFIFYALKNRETIVKQLT